MITDVNRDKPAPLKKEWDMLKVSIATMRILIGVLFLLSGIANYIYLNAEGGLVQTLMQSKLLLWGLGFEGVGPLPPLIGLPYAYVLPAVEIVAGMLFIINQWIRWAGILIMLMLLSFILAFGLFPPEGLLPNNKSNFDKNVFILVGAWICIAYDTYQMKRKQKLQESREHEASAW